MVSDTILCVGSLLTDRTVVCMVKIEAVLTLIYLNLKVCKMLSLRGKVVWLCETRQTRQVAVKCNNHTHDAKCFNIKVSCHLNLLLTM